MRDVSNIIGKKHEEIIKDEVEKWKSFHLSYKARIGIVKTFILSTFIFIMYFSTTG